MDAENIICLVILIICALPMIVIGIAQIKSKNPVGFWAGKEPPAKGQVRDVPDYNKKHGIMWILYGVGMPVSFFVGAPFGEGLGSAVAMTAEVVGGLILMIWYHNYLDKKYVRK